MITEIENIQFDSIKSKNDLEQIVLFLMPQTRFLIIPKIDDTFKNQCHDVLAMVNNELNHRLNNNRHQDVYVIYVLRKIQKALNHAFLYN